MTESEFVIACAMDKSTYLSVKEKSETSYKKEMEQKKGERIDLRVSKKEKDEIEKKAALAKMNQSKFILACCRSKPIIVIESLKEFTTELNRTGNNLNQIALLCHQGLISTPDLEEIRECLKEIYAELIAVNTKIRKNKK